MSFVNTMGTKLSPSVRAGMFRHVFCLGSVLIYCGLAPIAKADRDAASVYALYCAACHGADLQGGKVPSLLDGRWKQGSDDESLRKSIRDGIVTSGMPAFKQVLTEAEVRALIILIRESAKRAKDPVPEKSRELPAVAQTSEEHRYRIELVADELDVPWSMVFLPDGRLLFTERKGEMYLAQQIRPAEWTLQEIKNPPQVWVRDEGGLLALALHPEYANNGWIYLSFSDPGENDTSMLKVVRGRLRDGSWTDQETIYQAPPEIYTSNGINFGSRFVFSGDYLFFSVGERGAVGEAQDITRPNGKVHRIFHDGRIPPDNPFTQTSGAVGSIWSYGHRNPQGLAMHPSTGELWETEHGPRGGDELNYVEPGKNYGWPVITYGMNYDGTPVSSLTHHDGMEQPVLHWTPSIATSPLRFYTGDAFPRWKNQLFLGALAQQELRRLVVEGREVKHQEVILKDLGRVRDMITGPDGYLYVALELPRVPSRIVRLVPADQDETHLDR